MITFASFRPINEEHLCIWFKHLLFMTEHDKGLGSPKIAIYTFIKWSEASARLNCNIVFTLYCSPSGSNKPSAHGEKSMEGDGAATPASDTRPQKERPVWLMESTVEGAVTEDNTMVGECNNREALDSTVTCIICNRTLMCSRRWFPNVWLGSGKGVWWAVEGTIFPRLSAGSKISTWSQLIAR